MHLNEPYITLTYHNQIQPNLSKPTASNLAKPTRPQTEPNLTQPTLP